MHRNGRDINVKRRTWRNPAGDQSLILQKRLLEVFFFFNSLWDTHPSWLNLNLKRFHTIAVVLERREQLPASWCRGANRERKIK